MKITRNRRLQHATVERRNLIVKQGYTGPCSEEVDDETRLCNPVRRSKLFEYRNVLILITAIDLQF